MLIHLPDAAETTGKFLEFSFPYGRDRIRLRSEDYPVKDPGHLSLTIENTGNKVLLINGSGQVTVSIPCDRCLTPTDVEIPLSFSRKLDMKLSHEELVGQLDESSYLDGADLDTDELFTLEILVNWPSKVLCTARCRGLCPSCGKNLNEGSCGCAENAADPRMAKIRDLFELMKNQTGGKEV